MKEAKDGERLVTINRSNVLWTVKIVLTDDQKPEHYQNSDRNHYQQLQLEKIPCTYEIR